MQKFPALLLLVIFFSSTNRATAQQKDSADKGIYVTTGVGINKIRGPLHNTFRSTIAFNSAFEKRLGRHWFAQAEGNFNTLRYDQQKTDRHSEYLFQNTNSSLLMLAVNIGRDFPFAKNRWFVSPYLGTGYLNLGEPRISFHEPTGIAKQEVIRMSGILGKAGARVGFNTKSKLLQVLYFDGAYWTSSVKVNTHTVRSLSLFVGIRMAM